MNADMYSSVGQLGRGTTFNTTFSGTVNAMQNDKLDRNYSRQKKGQYNCPFHFRSISYKCITSPYAAAAASITASDIVGCG